MEIVFSADNRFVPHLCVTLLSIMDHNENMNLNFHVFTYDLSEENREYIKELVVSRKCQVLFYDIDLKFFDGFPIGKGTTNPTLTYATYLRLLIPDVLPNSISKVVYLDCDIVVVGSLKEFWEINIDDYCLAASSEHGIAADNGMSRLDIESQYGYFNAGVLILNLDKIREMDLFNVAKAYVKDHFKSIKFHDQDVLNALLHSSRLELSNRWNMRSDTDDTQAYTIIHYMSKPWNLECKHPLKYLYYDYLNQTRYAGAKQTHAYTKWQEIKMALGIRTRLQRMFKKLMK